MTAGEEEDNLDNVSDDNPNDDDEAKARKRKERLEQNRISARESRKRKKTMIEELQRTVITLSRENKELNERNEQLRRQLMEIGAKYPNVVPLQAIVGQAAPQAPADQPSSNASASASASAPAPATDEGTVSTAGVTDPTNSANQANV